MCITSPNTSDDAPNPSDLLRSEGWTLCQRCTLEGDESKKNAPEYGLLGKLQTRQKPSVYLNTYNPFCFVSLGVQGSGKSHSLSVVLENCVLRVGIVNSSDRLRSFADLRHEAPLDPPTLTRDKMLVLVSPSNYQQRKKKIRSRRS
jgi:hypothetical protein